MDPPEPGQSDSLKIDKPAGNQCVAVQQVLLDRQEKVV